jgi:hypothetical protein
MTVFYLRSQSSTMQSYDRVSCHNCYSVSYHVYMRLLYKKFCKEAIHLLSLHYVKI